MAPAGLIFDKDSIGEQQLPWVKLLNEGFLPITDPTSAPISWMVQPEWFHLISKSINLPCGDHWLSQLHLGVIHFHHGRKAEAKHAWEQSLQMSPSAWALRNLAVLALLEKQPARSCDLYLRAQSLLPNLAPLAIECVRGLIDHGQPANAMKLIDQLSPTIRQLGRIEFLRSRAALELGQLELVEKILLSDIVIADLREGELALTELWYRLQEMKVARETGGQVSEEINRKVRKEFPPPAKIDFRMMRE
jgi:tetratricopeptide (TPR) repeat protein